MTAYEHYWWDDAIKFALAMSIVTGLRHRVKRAGDVWRVQLADRQRPALTLVTEVCS